MQWGGNCRLLWLLCPRVSFKVTIQPRGRLGREGMDLCRRRLGVFVTCNALPGRRLGKGSGAWRCRWLGNEAPHLRQLSEPRLHVHHRPFPAPPPQPPVIRLRSEMGWGGVGVLAEDSFWFSRAKQKTNDSPSKSYWAALQEVNPEVPSHPRTTIPFREGGSTSRSSPSRVAWYFSSCLEFILIPISTGAVSCEIRQR